MTIQSGTEHTPQRGNYDDHDYEAFLARFKSRFLEALGSGPLFTTDTEQLYETYLDAFSDPVERQHHNCRACEHFIRRYASLVTIDEHGATAPAVLWAPINEYEEQEYGRYMRAFEGMRNVVRRAKVTGVFLSSERLLGTPITGTWLHLAVELPESMLYSRTILTANQRIAEKREDYLNVSRALREYSKPVLEQAVALLETDALYRSEKVLGAAKWLYALHVARDASHHRANVVWRAVATAPAGFCHPRASMIGTLLDDIAAGLAYDDVAAKFRAKMHPLQYQRPTAAPTLGALAQAEKIVADLGIARSLERRFARLDEVQALWRPRPEEKGQTEGVFGHIRARGKDELKPMTLPAQPMTWDKFARMVLPEAEKIEYYTTAGNENFTALLTALWADAPPIIQWDMPEHRNPVSWYVWQGGSPAGQWGLLQRKAYEVSAITFKPSMWYNENAKFAHQGEGVIFIIDKARETRQSGGALFPEILKSELHGIRSVIEAYSRRATIAGMEGGNACGVMLAKGHMWNARFRVTVRGRSQDYVLDRWD